MFLVVIINNVLQIRTVRADTGCRDGNGEAHDYCFAVAYSSTAIIPQCGNEWKHDPECGSFLEVHRGDPMKPFFKGSLDTRMITKSRIPLDTLFTNGFKTMVVSTLFETNQDTVYSFNFDPADNRTRVLCAGDYQLWYVPSRLYDLIEHFFITLIGGRRLFAAGGLWSLSRSLE